MQGILAALYWRDVLGGGRGQVIDVSLMESCFALLEHGPRVRPPGDRARAGGTGLKGVAPSNMFKSSDGKWMVIAANADNVFRRLCTAMGRPELADDAKYATHTARGDNQEELEAIVAAWAVQHSAAALGRLLNDAGVICGPIYTIADIFEDQPFRAREMLVEHDDPEFGRYIGPGVVPKFSETPGEVALVGVLGGREPQQRCVRRPAWTLRRRACAAEGAGRPMSVTICDVGPRDGLQNEKKHLDPETRAELVNRLAAAGLPRIEAVSFVNPARVPQMAGAEAVVAAYLPTSSSSATATETGAERFE